MTEKQKEETNKARCFNCGKELECSKTMKEFVNRRMKRSRETDKLFAKEIEQLKIVLGESKK